MAIKILAILVPIALFLFKYLLPSLAEAVYSKREREKKQALIEIIHFSVDLLFVAVGYSIPKIIEYMSELENIGTEKPDNIVLYTQMWSKVCIHMATTMLAIVFVPFLVFLTKIAENNCLNKKKKWILQTLFCYIVASMLIWFSVFRQ